MKIKKTRVKLPSNEKKIGSSSKQDHNQKRARIKRPVIVGTLGSSGQSRLEQYWQNIGFADYYHHFRKGDLPRAFLNQIESQHNIDKLFHLKGVDYGQYLTNEDRYNYLYALAIALYDLNSVLKIQSNNMGMNGTLGVTFGARGRAGALAHYEPTTNYINLTRYHKDKTKRKEELFVNSGGVGSFAHEYGHFLDYWAGSNIEPGEYYSLTAGSSLYDAAKPKYNPTKQPLRAATQKILNKACFDDKGNDSAFIKRIKKFSKKTYYQQQNEIFARLFEQYIAAKLKKKDIENTFLTKTKYVRAFYATPTELKGIIPLFDSWLSVLKMALKA